MGSTCARCTTEIASGAKFCANCGSPTSPVSPPSPSGEGGGPRPALPDRYEVVRFLGRGGMGRVYLCRDSILQVEVAVKVLPAEVSRDQESLDQIAREARAAAKFRGCPGILQLLRFDCHGETWFLEMEYAGGGSLHDRLRREGPLPEGECRRLGAEVAEALAFAHERGVLHRDIKPANVLLDESGRAKVADFGIAKVMAEASSRMSLVTVAGTPVYMAPEIILQERTDGRADLYSLGCMLYELATGARPFRGSIVEIQVRKTNPGARPPDPRAEKAELSEEFAAVVRRLLDRDPGNRFPDGRACAAALRAPAAEPVPPAPVEPPAAGPFPPPGGAAPPGSGSLSHTHPARPRPRAWVAVPIVAVAAAAGLVAWILRPRGPGDVPVGPGDPGAGASGPSPAGNGADAGGGGIPPGSGAPSGGGLAWSLDVVPPPWKGGFLPGVEAELNFLDDKIVVPPPFVLQAGGRPEIPVPLRAGRWRAWLKRPGYRAAKCDFLAAPGEDCVLRAPPLEEILGTLLVVDGPPGTEVTVFDGDEPLLDTPASLLATRSTAPLPVRATVLTVRMAKAGHEFTDAQLTVLEGKETRLSLLGQKATVSWIGEPGGKVSMEPLEPPGRATDVETGPAGGVRRRVRVDPGRYRVQYSTEAVCFPLREIVLEPGELRLDLPVVEGVAPKVRDIPEDEKAPAASASTGVRVNSAGSPGPRFSFPGYEEVLGEVDWKVVGASMSALIPLLRDLPKETEGGRAPDPGFLGKIQQHNGPLVQAALKIGERIPGEGINSRFAHPVFAANSIEATLEAAGNPLSDDQAGRLGRVAAEHADLDRVRLAGYDGKRWALQRVLDETDARDRFFEAAFAVLAPAQRDALRPGAIRGYCGFDLFSSGLIWVQFAIPLPAADRDDAVRAMGERLASLLGVPAERKDAFAGPVAKWIAAIPPAWLEDSGNLKLLGTPVLKASYAGACARAELDLLQRIAADASLGEGAAGKARGATVVHCPTLKR